MGIFDRPTKFKVSILHLPRSVRGRAWIPVRLAMVTFPSPLKFIDDDETLRDPGSYCRVALSLNSYRRLAQFAEEEFSVTILEGQQIWHLPKLRLPPIRPGKPRFEFVDLPESAPRVEFTFEVHRDMSALDGPMILTQ